MDQTTGQRVRLGALMRRLLLRVASEHGPSLDQVDPIPLDAIAVRQLVIEHATGKVTPTDVRGAVLDLIGAGWLRLAHNDDELLSPRSGVALTIRGLLRARRLDPACGRPATALRLRMKRGSGACVFSAALDSGNKDRDRAFNQAGLNLAAFYVVCAMRPTKEKPIWLADCEPWFQRLAVIGVGKRSGPGDRLEASREVISQAFDRVRNVLPLTPIHGEDQRRLGFYLAAPLPPVEIEGATGGQFREWSKLVFNLRQAIHGIPFRDKIHKLIEPRTGPNAGERSAGAAGARPRKRKDRSKLQGAASPTKEPRERPKRLPSAVLDRLPDPRQASPAELDGDSHSRE